MLSIAKVVLNLHKQRIKNKSKKEKISVNVEQVKDSD